jgi:hypothetical protein
MYVNTFRFCTGGTGGCKVLLVQGKVLVVQGESGIPAT